MDPFHANLLLLQCQQRLLCSGGGPRPFDCAIRLTAMASSRGSDGANSAELKEHILFGHCHILSAKSALLRAQLDQSPTTPTIQFLLQLNNSNGNAAMAQGLAAAGAIEAELRELKLDLSTFSEQNGQLPSLDAFKQFVAFLYGEPISPAMANNHSEQLFLLSKLFAIPELELAIRSALLSQLLGQPQSVVATSSNSTVFPMSNGTSNSAAVDVNQLPPLYAAYLQLQSLLGQQSIGGSPTADLAHQNGMASLSVQQQQNASPLSSIFPSNHPTLPFQQPSSLMIAASRPTSESSPEQQPMLNNIRRESASSTTSSIPSSNDGPMGGNTNVGGIGQNNNNEMLVPSNDKEGWCRNKKYIQIVKKGYRCLLCNKIYGRYNSVSYHVTIYHRNPPIRCEEQGCQFTTREARYIHFHKYYRHQIALPESIDLASRKCPLIGCKHVSKSPAMLDKHVQRHVADCLKEGGIYVCQMGGGGGDGNEFANGNNHKQCQFTANGHELMYTHLLTCHSLNRGAVDVTMKSEEDCTPPLQMSSAGEVDNLLNLKKTKENGVYRGISASAPNTPPTNGSNGTGTGARLHCQHCTFRGRTLSALEQHRQQKHRNNTIGQSPQHPSNHQLPPLPPSPFGPTGVTAGIGAFNGIFGGLFPAFAAAASSASLPDSPLSPNVGGGGLFPVFPPTSLLEQQNAQQHLLAQLFAAQKLASLLVVASSASSSPQQQQSPPASTTNAMTLMNENVAAENGVENANNENNMF